MAKSLRGGSASMPAWLVVVIVGAVLAVLGFAGIGGVLLWLGAAIVLSGLVIAIRGRRGGGRWPAALGGDEVEAVAPRQSLERRARRLGWVAAGLAVLSAVLLVLAVWLVAIDGRVVTSSSQPVLDGVSSLLPVDVRVYVPRVPVVLGLGLSVAAFVAGIAALQSAAAMRVLSRGRGLGVPADSSAASLARRMLGPAAVQALDLQSPPGWPITAIPVAADAAGIALRCTVLIPAHDEEVVIGRTLTSLAHQTRPPDRTVVVADNCTDATVRIARERGAEFVETVGNTRHKAGALNQVLAQLLPGAGVEDLFLVLDADSTISPDFVEAAVGVLAEDPDVMAVGGLFSGEDGGRLLGQLQRNEFVRYQRVIDRREGHLFVLTGTASMFRGYALRAVAQARGSLVPGEPGDVYDTRAMTEDNELTLALKSLGARMTSPRQCRVTTEVMPTWRALWRQRLRWQRGALENVGAYGFTRTTARYWAQQVALGYGVIALNSYLLMLVVALLAGAGFQWSIVWVVIGTVFVVERLVTAWAAGWRGRALALPLVVELGYALFLQATFVTSLVQIATHRRAGWNYVTREALAAVTVPAAAAAAMVTRWNPLPSSVLVTPAFEALCLFVGINTLVFATLSVFQLLPPIRRSVHRIQRRRATRHAPSAGS